MASKAYGLTAYYDSIVSECLIKKRCKISKENFLKEIKQLRYGENSSKRFMNGIKVKNELKQLSGKDLSYNNYNDIFILDILFSNFNSNYCNNKTC